MGEASAGWRDSGTGEFVLGGGAGVGCGDAGTRYPGKMHIPRGSRGVACAAAGGASGAHAWWVRSAAERGGPG